MDHPDGSRRAAGPGRPRRRRRAGATPGRVLDGTVTSILNRTDLPLGAYDLVEKLRGAGFVPGHFVLGHIAIEVTGLCERCGAHGISGPTCKSVARQERARISDSRPVTLADVPGVKRISVRRMSRRSSSRSANP